MPPSANDIETIKQKMKASWIAGDFGVIGRYAEQAEEEFVQRLGIKPGMRVLDVACGTGNTALPAARAGAHVTGVDIAPNLLEQAKKRAGDAGLNIDFREGDAEGLDFSDASFDLIISVFGAMFAPRPERVAAELLRVCRPGGTIAMANWIPTGLVGKMFAVNARHAPPPPGIPAPTMWGDENTVRERFNHGAANVKCTVFESNFRYPFPPREVVELFRRYFGPTHVAFSRLDESGQRAYFADLERLWSDHNLATDGSTNVPAEYLEVHAIKA